MNATITSMASRALILGAFGMSLAGGMAQEAAPAATPTPPPAPEPKSKWERSAAVGLTLTQGNSDTVLLTANIQALRKWDSHEIRLGADGAYGEVNSVKNQDSLHGFAQYNRLLTDRFYGYVKVDALQDDIADVDYRFTLGPGAGYYFIKNPKTQLSVEAGPSFVIEKQGGRTDEYLAARLAERFEHKLNDRARIWQSVEFLPQVDHVENFIINAEIGVEASLTKSLKLRVFAQDTYDNEPSANRKKNDLKLVSALAYEF